jgi:hypothetical protein
MCRSGYTDDCENLNLYRATVTRSILGKRGQAFLRNMATALDALPEKMLIAGELINENGACCALGAVCKFRNIDVSKIDYLDLEIVGAAVGISRSMAAEIEYENDERGPHKEDPADRWKRIRAWVDENLNASNNNHGE